MASTAGISAARWASAASLTRCTASAVSRVTPGTRAAPGSTSRGTARSTMKRRRVRRAAMARPTSVALMIVPGAAVALTTASACASTSARAARGADRAPTSSPNRTARARVRLTTVTRTLRSVRALATSSRPVAPAPMTAMSRPAREPSSDRNRLRAADGIEAFPEAIRVSARARRPAQSARCSSRSSSGPMALACRAARYASRT